MSVFKSKISDQLQNRGQFAQIPNEIYQVKELSNYARSIWIYLASEGPGWKGSYPNISKTLGFSVNTVRKSVKELEALNMLTATGHETGTDFELLSTDQWVVTWTEYYQRQLDKKTSASIEPAQRKGKTGANAPRALGPVHPVGCIQEEPKLPKPINTTAAGVPAGRVGGRESVYDLGYINKLLSEAEGDV